MKAALLALVLVLEPRRLYGEGWARPESRPGPSSPDYGVTVATCTRRVPAMPASVGSPFRYAFT